MPSNAAVCKQYRVTPHLTSHGKHWQRLSFILIPICPIWRPYVLGFKAQKKKKAKSLCLFMKWNSVCIHEEVCDCVSRHMINLTNSRPIRMTTKSAITMSLLYSFSSFPWISYFFIDDFALVLGVLWHSYSRAKTLGLHAWFIDALYCFCFRVFGDDP